MSENGHVGTVIAVEGPIAVIRFARSSMCAHCGACMTAGEHEMEARVPNALDAQIGDRVSVALSGKKIAGASLIAYLIPLVALLVGVFVGSIFSDIAAIVGGLCCCAAAYLILRLLDRRFARMQSFQPHMIAIVTEKEEAEDGKRTDSRDF